MTSKKVVQKEKTRRNKVETRQQMDPKTPSLCAHFSHNNSPQPSLAKQRFLVFVFYVNQCFKLSTQGRNLCPQTQGKIHGRLRVPSLKTLYLARNRKETLFPKTVKRPSWGTLEWEGDLPFFTLISPLSYLPRERSSAPRLYPAVAVIRVQLAMLVGSSPARILNTDAFSICIAKGNACPLQVRYLHRAFIEP